MKRLLLAILLLAVPAVAAPDVPGAISEIEAARVKLAEQEKVIVGHRVIISELLGESRQKDQAIVAEKAKTADAIRKAAEQHKRDTNRLNGWIGGLLGLAGVASIVGGGFLGFALLKSIDVGTGCVGFGAFLIGAALAVVHYGQQIALFAAIGCGLAAVGFFGWLVIRARKREAAGVNQANVVDVAEANPLFTKDHVNFLRAAQFKLAGGFGDLMTAIASGKSVKQAREDGQTAAAVAASTTIVPGAGIVTGGSTA